MRRLSLFDRLSSLDFWLKAGLGLVLLGGVLNSLSKTLADVNLWGYMSFGRLFWESRIFPYQDVFSFAPTLNPWVYHEWLTGVLFYPIYRTWGAAGLQLLKFGMGLSTVLFLYLTARRRGADFFSTVIILWTIQLFLAVGYSPVRAQVFTYTFFAFTLFLLENARLQGQWRGLWLLIPLQALWCNLHGGFLAGLGLTGLYAVGEALSRRRFWPYAGILALSALATLINPYGLDYYPFLFRALTMPRAELTEWTSFFGGFLTVMSLEEFTYLLLVVILAGFLLWWARWREITAGLALALTLYLGLKHVRHLVFFMLLVGAYVPLAMTSYLAVLTARPPWVRLTGRLGRKFPVALFLFLALIYGYQFYHRGPLKLETPSYPTKENQLIYYPLGAVEVIQRYHLSGKLLSDFNWGEFLIWTLYPQCRVALDGRYENVYPEEVSRQFFDFINVRGAWERFLELYRPDMILINIRHKVYPRLHRSPWRQIYADSGSVLFMREDKLPSPLRQMLQEMPGPGETTK